MSKPKKGIVAWLGDVFGSTHKTISEKLSAEEYNQLVADAEKYRASQSDQDEPDEEEDQEEEEDEEESADPKNTDPKGATIEARLAALEQKYGETSKALKAEQKAHKATTTKLTETEQKLKLSETQKGKLRQAVNPLGDEDTSNQEAKNAGLTKTDIEAREAWKKNHPKA